MFKLNEKELELVEELIEKIGASRVRNNKKASNTIRIRRLNQKIDLMETGRFQYVNHINGFKSSCEIIKEENNFMVATISTVKDNTLVEYKFASFNENSFVDYELAKAQYKTGLLEELEELEIRKLENKLLQLLGPNEVIWM